MKKTILLVLLALPSLACFMSNVALAAVAPTTAITDSPIVYLPTPTGTQEPACRVTALETLNLRKAPGAGSAVIAVLKHGDLLTILPGPAQGVWIRVRVSGLEGWINSNYCERKNQR